MSKSRQKLIAELESIIGNSCYNGKIQNWGPGGEWQGEGREFRYPINFLDEQGNKIKDWRTDPLMEWEQMKTGFYAFGANQLHIISDLEKIVDKLEKEFGLKL